MNSLSFINNKMPPKRKVLVIPEQKKMVPKYKEDDLSLTEAEYIFASVIEWYRVRGIEIPEEDINWCEEYIKQELEEKERHIQLLNTPLPPEKPSFGSGDYWKDYWAKKKAAGYVTKKDAKASKKD